MTQYLNALLFPKEGEMANSLELDDSRPKPPNVLVQLFKRLGEVMLII